MITRKLSSKNQITIPKSVRQGLGIRSNQDVGIEYKHNDYVLVKPKKNLTHKEKIRRFWNKMARNTKKYGSDDTSYHWGKDVGAEKLGDK